MDYDVEIDKSKLRILRDHSGPGKLAVRYFIRILK